MPVAAACARVHHERTLFLMLFRYLHAHLEEIFTNLSAVSVYAPSGNTGGVEVKPPPRASPPSLSKRSDEASAAAVQLRLSDSLAGHWHAGRSYVA